MVKDREKKGSGAARRRFNVWVLGCSAWLLACDGTEPRAMVGESKAFGDAQAFTWANLNSSQELVEFGVTIPFSALNTISEGASLTLALPAEAQSAAMSRQVVIDYSRRAFLPLVYQVPRLDVRFYGIDERDRQAIDCVDEPMPGPGALPAPYKISSTRPLPDGDCLPSAGVFAHDPGAPELRPVDPALFENAVMLGYHRGTAVLVSLTMPIDRALAKKSFEAQVPRSSKSDDGVAWPSRAMAITNGFETTLNFSLGKLRPR